MKHAIAGEEFVHAAMLAVVRCGVKRYDSPMKSRIPLVAALAALLLLPGCIVSEIRDQMVAANESLDRVELALERIDATNARLKEVETKLKALETMESINGSLVSIDGTLHKLDDHLASLRRTIDNIDSTIPFLSISGDSEEEEAEGAEGGEPGSTTVPAEGDLPVTTDGKGGGGSGG